MQTIKLLRRPATFAESGLPRSSLYEAISKQLFVHPVRCGSRSVAWPAHEVAAINAARVAGKNDTEIRALVAELEAARALVDIGVTR